MADRYIRGSILGEGTWGAVYEAFDKGENRNEMDPKKVAIKRIKPMESHLGLNFTALREIKYLKLVRGRNITQLIDVFISNDILHLVLEFCPYDLEKIIRDKSIYLKTYHVKSYFKMLLEGLNHCHQNFVLHRDLKPANLMIGSDGVLKIGDFGLSRKFGSPDPMTSEVVTRWYRAPELLFGATFYSYGVDMWAAGCIFAELILRVPLFSGNTDIEQLGKIFNVLGTPTELNWPGVEKLQNHVQFEHRDPLNLSSLFRKSSTNSNENENMVTQDLQLLLKIIALNPNNRYTSTKALEHDYFKSSPEPCLPEELPTPKK